MKNWHNVSAGFKPGERRTALTQKTLVAAYRDVFGRDNEAVQVVLADLANHCGFYRVATPGVTPDALMYDAGMRAAYARIFNFLSLPPEHLAGLETAVRSEALTDEQEGIF